MKRLGEIDIPEANVTDAELGLARQFIQNMAKPKFDIALYKDDYRERLRDLIDHKIKGEEVVLTPAPAPQAKVVDLMEALKASLQRAGSPAAAAPVAAPPPAPVVVEAPAAAAGDEARKPPRRSPRSEEAGEKKKKAKS